MYTGLCLFPASEAMMAKSARGDTAGTFRRKKGRMAGIPRLTLRKPRVSLRTSLAQACCSPFCPWWISRADRQLQGKGRQEVRLKRGGAWCVSLKDLSLRARLLPRPSISTFLLAPYNTELLAAHGNAAEAAGAKVTMGTTDPTVLLKRTRAATRPYRVKENVT